VVSTTLNFEFAGFPFSPKSAMNEYPILRKYSLLLSSAKTYAFKNIVAFPQRGRAVDRLNAFYAIMLKLKA